MLKIRRLYSNPNIFEPIEFCDGFNLILGETTEATEKTNGVGKSMAIEFISYALLKRHVDSRVALIPEKYLASDTQICLDFELAKHHITSIRTIGEHDFPTLIIDGETTKYESVSDARDHLGTLLFNEFQDRNPPSFRLMMGPLIREEGSEFKSIIDCYDTKKRVPPNYSPHLYLLHIDPLPYTEAKRLHNEYTDIGKARKKMEENILTITGKDVANSKAELNELERQVEKIQTDIDRLENIEGYDSVKNEIIDIEKKLERDRSTQAVLKSELANIKLFRGDNYIDEAEVAELYNQFKEGLGDYIQKNLDEVTSFKRKIDEFQRTLVDSRRSELTEGIRKLDKLIAELSSSYREKVSLLDQEGLLVSLKQTIAIHQKKAEELSALSSFIHKHAEYDRDYKDKKRERDEDIYLLDSLRNDASNIKESFEKTIREIHEYVYQNQRCSFEIEISKKKEIVKFDLRADSDGSHSINREIVFFYDMSLLLTQETADLHPGLLIHDNIFDVDQDTLVKSLNFVYDRESLISSQQYILTLNGDKLSDQDKSELYFDIDHYTRASFTKENRFLSFNYQELSSARGKS